MNEGAKRESGDRRGEEEEDHEGETVGAINKVNRRHLRDKRGRHLDERNKRSEGGSR